MSRFTNILNSDSEISADDQCRSCPGDVFGDGLPVSSSGKIDSSTSRSSTCSSRPISKAVSDEEIQSTKQMGYWEISGGSPNCREPSPTLRQSRSVL